MKTTPPTPRIALAQVNTTVGNLKANAALVMEWCRSAIEARADLVVFPELTLTGYPPEDLLLRQDFVHENIRILKELAKTIGTITACVGYVEQDHGRLYNSLAVIRQGRIRRVYRKIELPNYGVFDEKRYFTQGESPLLLDAGGLTVCLTICEDIWVEDGPAEKACASTRVDLVLNASASPYYKSKVLDRTRLLQSKARLNGCAFGLCNLVGGQDELVFDGASLAVDAESRVICRAEQFREELLVFDLPSKPVRLRNRKRRSRNGLPRLALPVLPDHGQPALRRLAGLPDPVMEVYRALVTGTADYINKNGFDTVVLGMSGGIDSAVVAAIAVEALGADRVKAVTMPSIFSSDATYNDAILTSENLGIEIRIIPIKSVYQAYLDELKPEFKDLAFDKTEENLQARIRGNLLMSLSNKYGWIVLTTGNKSELSVGYSTIYGDMAGGFSVIKDVYKTLVYKIADLINREREIIPRSVIERPPTAELRPGQKDQDTLPPYDLLDRILQLYIEKDKGPGQIAAEGFDEETVRKVVRMVDMNEYKRRQSAIGVKITPKAFGRDRRMPVVNRFA